MPVAAAARAVALALVAVAVAALVAAAHAEQHPLSLGSVRGLVGATAPVRNKFTIAQIDPFQDTLEPLANVTLAALASRSSYVLNAMTIDAANGIAYTHLYTQMGTLQINPQIVTTDLDTGKVVNVGAPLHHLLTCIFFDPASSTLFTYWDNDGVARLMIVGAATGDLALVAAHPIDVTGFKGHTGCQYVPSSRTMYTMVQDGSGAQYSLQFELVYNTTSMVPIKTTDTVLDYVVDGGVLYVLTGTPSGSGFAYTLNTVSPTGDVTAVGSLGTLPKFYAAGPAKMIDVPTNTYIFLTESATSSTSVQLVVVNLRTASVVYSGDLSARPVLTVWAA